MAPVKAVRKASRREPTLADEIAASGETEASSAEQAARADREDFQFLAREFLTWLVWHAETAGGAFSGEGDVPDFSIQFGGKVALKAADGAVSDMTLKGSAPGLSPDVRYALAGGLGVKEAELQLFLDGDEERGYVFTLSDEYFDLKRVNIPALLTEEEDDKADERIMLLSGLDAALELAFRHFIGERVRPTWAQQTVPALRQWLVEGTKP